MKTHLSMTAVLLLGGLLLNGCGGGGESNDVTQPIVFDPISDQYDPNAMNIVSIAYVNSVRNAVLLGMKHVNEAGGVLGKPLNVMAYVTTNTEDTLALANELLTTDVQVFNVSFSSRSQAVAELAIPQQKLIISESATSTVFSSFDDDDYYFRMVPSDVYQGRILSQVALRSGASTAVTVFNQGDQYGETLVTEFSNNFTQAGGTELARLSIPFSVESGFDSYLQQVGDLQPDVVINTILEASIAANFVNESAAFNLSSQFILPDSAAGVSGFVNSIANFDVVDGALGTSPGFGLATSEQMQYFSDAYEQQFGLLPEGFTVNGYDFVLVTALAIERAGLINNTDSPTGQMIRDSLRAVMNPPGEVVTPSNFQQALTLVRSGVDVDFTGGYGATDWDANGDIVGEMTFDILRVDGESGSWVTDSQEQIFVPLEDIP